MNAIKAFSVIFVFGCLCSRQQLDWSSDDALEYFRSKLRSEMNRIEHELPYIDEGKLVNKRVVELFTDGKKRRELIFDVTVEKSGSHSLMIDRISTGVERYSLMNPAYTATLEKFRNGVYGVLNAEQKPYKWTFLKSNVEAAFRTVGNFSISDVFEQPFIRCVDAKEGNGRAIFKFEADPNDEQNTTHVVSFVVEFDTGSQLPVKFDCVFRNSLTTGPADRRNVIEYIWESFPEFGVIAPKTKIITTYNDRGFVTKKETSNTDAFPLGQFEKEKCYTTFYGIREPFQQKRHWLWWLAGLITTGTVLALVSRFVRKRQS